jgi:Ni,Fe-hydrogenase I cytochrome b subunit
VRSRNDRFQYIIEIRLWKWMCILAFVAGVATGGIGFAVWLSWGAG